MAFSDKTVSLALFVLVFGVTFPVFAFAFTFQSGTPQIGSVSLEALIQAGIDIGDSETHVLNGTTVNQEYALTDFTYYASWDNLTLNAFWFSRNHEFLPFFKVLLMVEPDFDTHLVSEAYIIDQYDATYEWSHISVRGSDTWAGLPLISSAVDCEALFTIPLYANGTAKYDNMTAALNANEITLTIGRSWGDVSPNISTFANWMTRLISGADTYGMPDILIWVIRIVSLMALLVGIMFIMEIIPL